VEDENEEQQSQFTMRGEGNRQLWGEKSQVDANISPKLLSPNLDVCEE